MMVIIIIISFHYFFLWVFDMCHHLGEVAMEINKKLVNIPLLTTILSICEIWFSNHKDGDQLF
jgi:hypothetical protein